MTLASWMALESLPGREWRRGQVEERPSRVTVLFRTPPGIHEEVRTVGNRVGVGGIVGRGRDKTDKRITKCSCNLRGVGCNLEKEPALRDILGIIELV